VGAFFSPRKAFSSSPSTLVPDFIFKKFIVLFCLGLD
jgi:hypothetical protein